MSQTVPEGLAPAQPPAAEAPARPRRARFAPPELPQATLDELDEKHDDVIVMRGDEKMSPWVLVLRRPTRPETLLWKSNSKKTEGQQASVANEILIRATTVWPAQNVVDYQIAKWALLADAITNNPTWRAFVGVQTDADLKG